MGRSKGAEFDNLTQVEICKLFHICSQTITGWIKAGCPRNNDNSMSAYQVHVWLMKRAEAKNKDSDKLTLKDQKLAKDIELTGVKISKAKEELVERAVMEDMLASRAGTISEYWRTSIIKNIAHLANQPQDTLAELLMSLICQGTANLVKE